MTDVHAWPMVGPHLRLDGRLQTLIERLADAVARGEVAERSGLPGAIGIYAGALDAAIIELQRIQAVQS